jgi:hypothetical protein
MATAAVPVWTVLAARASQIGGACRSRALVLANGNADGAVSLPIPNSRDAR